MAAQKGIMEGERQAAALRSPGVPAWTRDAALTAAATKRHEPTRTASQAVTMGVSKQIRALSTSTSRLGIQRKLSLELPVGSVGSKHPRS